MSVNKSMTNGLPITVLMVALCLSALWAAKPARAHEGDGETPADVQQLKQEVDQLQEKIRHLDKHILHRPETEERKKILDGLEIALGVTGVVQGSAGADDIAGGDHTDASVSLDLEVETRVGNQGTAFLLIEGRHGAGLTDEIETLHGINADAVDDDATLKLTEAWYEHSFLSDRLLLTLGKVDLTNYFDTNAVANDETTQFLADGLVNNLAVEFPEDNGPGLRLSYSVNAQFELKFGLGDADGDFEDVFRDVFGVVELNYKPSMPHGDGNYRFHLWTNLADHAEWRDPSRNGKENWGLGFSFDQVFSERITGFLRGGFQDKAVSQVDRAFSLGGEIRGLFPGRAQDHLAIALGYAHLSKDYRDSVRPLNTADEQVLEVYYNIHVNDQLSVSPDLQLIRNPAGLDGADTTAILGVRGQLIF